MMNTEPPLPRDGGFILLVEDDPTSLAVLQRILRKNFPICSAKNAEEAVEILQARVPALVILDVMMPEVSGIELCKLIKSTKRLQDVPVIFLSASDTPGDYKQGYAAGGVMYLAKPTRPAQLLQMVRLYASRIEKKETVG